jgi:predicted RNA-binding protein with PUA-like domain
MKHFWLVKQEPSNYSWSDFVADGGTNWTGVRNFTAYRDTTAKEGDWSAVDLAPIRRLPKPVTLGQIKAKRELKEIALVRQSRLSVMPLAAKEFNFILRMAR